MTEKVRHRLEIVFNQLGRNIRLTPPDNLRELYPPTPVSPRVLASMIVLGQESEGDGVTLEDLIRFLQQVKEEVTRDPKFLVNLHDCPVVAQAAA